MNKLIAFLVLAVAAVAATLNFAWDDPNPAGTVKEYGFYEIANGGNVRLGTATNQVYRHTFGPGEHNVFVTAIGMTGLESDPSNVLTFYVPHKPQNIAIVVVPQQ